MAFVVEAGPLIAGPFPMVAPVTRSGGDGRNRVGVKIMASALADMFVAFTTASCVKICKLNE